MKRKVGPGVFKSRLGVQNGVEDADKANFNCGLEEVQVCLKNYKKGGEPFENLLTVVPIPWEDGGEVRYLVGFQVDRATTFI
jgi:hypothetical protein